MTLSVGRLARRFGLSRATLLYYDRIGLLSPSSRSRAGYRLYGPAEVERLAAICRYRQVGLSLAQVEALLAGEASRARAILRERLDQLSAEIEALRGQQQTILRLLAGPGLPPRGRVLDKERWVAILRATGLDDAAMRRWHVEFERAAPGAHRDFLRALGLSAQAVARIRRWSRAER